MSIQNRFLNHKDSELLAFIFINLSKDKLEELNEAEYEYLNAFAKHMFDVLLEIENET